MKKAIISLLAFSLILTLTSCNNYTKGTTNEFEWEYDEEMDGIVITKYIGSDKNIEIPDTIKGKPVQKIEGAFEGCPILEVAIPNSVISIGDDAFSGCTKLKNIKIPNRVTYIGNRAFLHCSSLENINLPDNINFIGDHAFAGCMVLTDLVLPNGVTHIGIGAFFGCIGLKDVTIPNSVEYIGEGAFNDIPNLKITYNGEIYTSFLYDKDERGYKLPGNFYNAINWQ